MFKKIIIFSIFVAAAFSFSNFAQAQSGIIYFSPAGGAFTQGQIFWLTIMADTKGTAVNAVAVYFTYPQDQLEPVGISTDGSVLTIWADKNIGSGSVVIIGGLPTPGFSGVQKIAAVGFRPKVSSGSASLILGNDSVMLTDVGNQNILNLSGSGSGNYSFKAQPAAAPAAPVAPPVSPQEEAQSPAAAEVPAGETPQPASSVSTTTSPAGEEASADIIFILLVIGSVLAGAFVVSLILKIVR